MRTSTNLIGEPFGTLVVIGPGGKDKYGRTLWECQCNNCGNIVVRSKHHLKQVKSCGCLHGKGISKARWKGHEEISGHFWCTMMHNAKVRELEFTVTMSQVWELFIAQERKCALSGLPINFSRSSDKSRKSYQSQTASLDRIDSSLGYIAGNVQWVHKVVQKMKMDLCEHEFIDMCHLVSANNSSTSLGSSTPALPFRSS